MAKNLFAHIVIQEWVEDQILLNAVKVYDKLFEKLNQLLLTVHHRAFSVHRGENSGGRKAQLHNFKIFL